MCSIHVRGITTVQMDQLVEMTHFFYDNEDTHVFQDPDFPDNIVISSEKGDNYNTVGWFQVCFDLILPKLVVIVYKGTVLRGWYHFVDKIGLDEILEGHHPVDMLYPPFLAIKSEKDDKRGESNLSG